MVTGSPVPGCGDQDAADKMRRRGRFVKVDPCLKQLQYPPSPPLI
jgi:hypothetical protein